MGGWVLERRERVETLEGRDYVNGGGELSHV